jgi:hypothetical protein
VSLLSDASHPSRLLFIPSQRLELGDAPHSARNNAATVAESGTHKSSLLSVTSLPRTSHIRRRRSLSFGHSRSRWCTVWSVGPQLQWGESSLSMSKRCRLQLILPVLARISTVSSPRVL